MDESNSSIPNLAPAPVAAPELAYPVVLTVEYPVKSSQLIGLTGLLFPIKMLITVPHLIVLYFLSIIALFCAFINFIIVIFTGKQNRSLFDLILSYQRWNARVQAWLFGLTDKYPPFELN